MKFDITIKDATFSEVQDIMLKLSNNALFGAVMAQNFEAAKATLEDVSIPTEGSITAAIPSIYDGIDELPSETDVTGQVDSMGLAWDSRIHSSNKKKAGTGMWVRRRGVPEATFNQIVNELRSGYQPQPIVSNTQVAVDLPQVEVAPAPVAQPQYAPAPVAQPQTINDLFVKIQQLFATGNANAEYMLSLTSRLSQHFQVQVNTINDISGRPDMIAYAFQLLSADGK